mmetsp:Transcript_92989/g.259041  ORF Transcript_92989/g.259041 Transcript_92989/m.259041 type:complete len:256 (+) Transcript_92989:873-1640(+)
MNEQVDHGRGKDTRQGPHHEEVACLPRGETKVVPEKDHLRAVADARREGGCAPQRQQGAPHGVLDYPQEVRVDAGRVRRSGAARRGRRRARARLLQLSVFGKEGCIYKEDKHIDSNQAIAEKPKGVGCKAACHHGAAKRTEAESKPLEHQYLAKLLLGSSLFHEVGQLHRGRAHCHSPDHVCHEERPHRGGPAQDGVRDCLEDAAGEENALAAHAVGERADGRAAEHLHAIEGRAEQGHLESIGPHPHGNKRQVG